MGFKRLVDIVKVIAGIIGCVIGAVACIATGIVGVLLSVGLVGVLIVIILAASLVCPPFGLVVVLFLLHCLVN